MKFFIKKMFFFSIILLVLASILDFYYTFRIRNSQSREYRIWEDIFNSRIKADMIVLGSSRAYAHYNPYIFEKELNTDFYNLGLNGKLGDMDIFIYHQYKKYHNHLPQYIIWDIMQNTFDVSGGYGDEQFMGYIHNKDVWKIIHQQGHKITLVDKYVPLLRYWRKNMIHTYPNAIMEVYKGYRKESHPFDHTGLQDISDHSLPCRYNREIINQFENAIDEMQKDGSNVFLVFSPMYSEGQNKINDLGAYIDTINNLAIRHNCIFLNYLQLPINSDTSLFKNASHLNAKGADIFSTILAHDLDSIYSISKSTCNTPEL